MLRLGLREILYHSASLRLPVLEVDNSSYPPSEPSSGCGNINPALGESGSRDDGWVHYSLSAQSNPYLTATLNPAQICE